MKKGIKDILLKSKMPIGMIIIIFWFLRNILSYLMKSANPQLLGPIVLVGISAILWSIFVSALNFIAFYGVYGRKKWTWKYIIGLEIFTVLHMLIFAIIINTDREGKYTHILFSKLISNLRPSDVTSLYLETLKDSLITKTTGAFLSTLAVGVIISIYVYKKRSYFKQ